MAMAKDGSKHHSFGRAKLHDDMNADKEAESKPKPKAMADGGGGAAADPAPAEPGAAGEMESMADSPESIHDVVSEHGPAEEVHHKVGADGQHHVLTHHGKHKHKSSHMDHQSAHQHMGHAMGMGGESGGMPNAPEPAGAAMGGGGGGIPGLE